MWANRHTTNVCLLHTKCQKGMVAYVHVTCCGPPPTSPQAINKLTEVMNRRMSVQGVQVVSNDTEVRRRKKQNQKLQQELRSEKEKLNSVIIKYQRELNDMQAVSREAARRPRASRTPPRVALGLARTCPCESRPMEMRPECCLAFGAFGVWNDLLVWKRFRFYFLMLRQW